MPGINTDDIVAALGYRPGVRMVDVVFTNPDVDTGTVPEHVSPVGGMIALRSAAATVEVLSDSATDTAAGTGARSVLIWGLDASYNEVSETLTLAGLTPVLSTTMFFRVNSVTVLTAGTNKTNAGNITVRGASAGATVSYIQAARGRSEVGVFTVPAGCTMLATGWNCASRDATGNSSADVEFYTTKGGVRSIDWSMVISGTIPASLGSPHVFPEKTDIEVVVSRVLNSNTLVFFHGHGLLVQSEGTGL